MKTKLTLIIFCIMSIFTFAQNSEQNGKEFIQNFFAKKYEVAVPYFQEKLQKQLDAKTLEQLGTQLQSQIGDLVKINSTRSQSSGENKIIFYNSDFTNGNFDVQVAFDAQGKIGGFHVLPGQKEDTPRPQTPKPPFSYQTEDVTFKNEIQGNLLAGTIARPNDKKDTPIFVLITGSGPQNRDEELFGHRPFAVIADYLAKNGIATLRIDDRGMGQSEKGKDNPTIEDFATDINTAVDFLAKNGYTNIGMIGHSEGGIIAPMVALQNKKVKRIIMLAGPGVPGLEMSLLQSRKIMETEGMTKDYIEKTSSFNKSILEFAVNYKGNSLEKDLTALVQKLNPSLSEVNANQIAKSVDNSEMSSILKSKPEQYLSKLKIPVLALNGSLDVQVLPKENLAAIKLALTKAGNKKFEIVEVPGVNHLFQTAKTGSPNEYAQIEESFSPKVLELMKNWILKSK